MTPYYENYEDDLRVFYADDLQFPAHLHSQMELIYVITGIIEVTIFNKTKTLVEGDFAVVFPNTLHSYASKTSEKPCRILLAICGLNLTGDYFKKVTSYYPLNPFIPSEKQHANIGFAMLELEKERYEGQDLNVCRALLLLILSRIIPILDLTKNQDIKDYDLTHMIVSYVSEHFQEALTLTELAKHLNVSKFYLSRVFSTKLNTNFNTYINNIRLNYALTLIQSTSYSLTRISNDSGFESQRTFNRTFKDIFHLSPSEYRKRATMLNKDRN
ncbi:MAG: DNA-binding protein AraC-type [Herbinix sp.]|jgi:AraC-like DNA-binding protein|nr:DNA-binding protein AraC-type [Herbinix sp.]